MVPKTCHFWRNGTMQPFHGTDMDLDDAVSLSSPSPTLAAAEQVLPHSDDSKQLVDQASHLTLATSSSNARRTDASPVPHERRLPDPPRSRSRSQTCSACWLPASEGPRPPHRDLSRALSNALGAQHAPWTSYDHAREEQTMRPAAAGKQDCHRMLLGEVLPLLSVPTGPSLDDLPNEVLLHILGYLDVYDLLVLSRVSECGDVMLCSSLQLARGRSGSLASPSFA